MENEPKRTEVNPGERQFDISFGKRVREARTARKWSQEHLAKQLADYGLTVHQTQIAKIESGSRTVKLPEAVALARSLAVPLETLVGPSARPPSLATRKARVIDQEDLKILRRQMAAVEYERAVAYQELSITEDRHHVAEVAVKSAQEELQRERKHMEQLRRNAHKLEHELANLRNLEHQYEEQIAQGGGDAPEEEDES